MPRRSMLAGGGSATGGEIPPPTGTVTPTPIPPYAVPIAAPFNVGTLAVTPTVDGTGEAMHPDVWDAGPGGWNGKRYWLATTAFADAANQNENPHIMCSNNGWVFEWPAPGINPLADWPGRASGDTLWYYSDTDIHHDPATNELVVTWREVHEGHQRIWLTTSTTGTTWSTPVVILDIAEPGGVLETTSQSLIKVSATEWRMYFAGGSGGAPKCRVFFATSRLGPYGSPQQLAYSASEGPYHGDVIKHGDRYYALFQSDGEELPATSIDGITFTVGPAILQSGTYFGLKQDMYRSTMQIDPLNPSMVGVWYGAHENNSAPPDNKFNTAYTRVPLSRWPTL